MKRTGHINILIPVAILMVLVMPFITINAASETDKRAFKPITLIVKEEGERHNTIQLYEQMVAVIIGVDVYENLSAKYHLKYAVNDARGIEKVLKEKYNFSRIIAMYNKDATREEIMKVLQGKLSTIGSDDAVLIYYAGHGMTRTTAQGKLGYLIPYDGSMKDDEMYKNISMQQIKGDVSPSISAKHVLFIVDACFGGLLLGQRAAGLEASHNMSYLKEITREPARQIITAGGENEEVLDGGLYGHSVFTGRLIEALRNNSGFLTAKEIGVSLEGTVYGDAMAKSHKQRPQSGAIYGTGDFVFVPDMDKRQGDADSEVAALEADMKRLQNLKIQASKRKNEAEIREIERERLLRENELKQAQLRKQAADSEAELKRKMELEAQSDVAERERREAESVQQLAYLKRQTEKMLQELGGSPAAALGLSDAQAEVIRLNQLIAKLQGDYDTELSKQLKPVVEYYKQKISKAQNIKPWDKMFETKSQYQARAEEARKKASTLKVEQEEKIASINKQVKDDLEKQLAPLRRQIIDITKQEFPVGHGDIKWKFEKYDPIAEVFSLSGRIKDKQMLGIVAIPRAKAKHYYQNPDLLIASAVLTVDKNGGSSIFKGLTLQGLEGDKFQATRIEQGVMDDFTSMEFVYVKGGCYQMGDTFGDGSSDEKPVHEVCVDDYYIGKYEVTQGQWEKVIGSNPSDFKDCGENCPVEGVSWNDVQEFIKKLNSQTDGKYRLPTEVEWEYACRSGGKNEKYSGGSDVESAGWYSSNSGSKTHQVGTKSPNGLGIYDMSGNVWEWVQDWYSSSAYKEHSRKNPIYDSPGSPRVIRGGSWDNYPQFLRCAYRIYASPDGRDRILGFRLLRLP